MQKPRKINDKPIPQLMRNPWKSNAQSILEKVMQLTRKNIENLYQNGTIIHEKGKKNEVEKLM